MVSSDNDYSKAATTAFLQAVRARNNQTTELPLCMANHFILRANATDEEAKELIKVRITWPSTVNVFFTPVCVKERLIVYLLMTISLSYFMSRNRFIVSLAFMTTFVLIITFGIPEGMSWKVHMKHLSAKRIISNSFALR